MQHFLLYANMCEGVNIYKYIHIIISYLIIIVEIWNIV
jgi:hypothetical protein